MRRATFDTNTYISALVRKGALRKLLVLAGEGVFDLQVSDEILDELEEVAMRDFFLTKEQSQAARIVVLSVAHLIVPHVQLRVVERDPDDNRILECALASKSDYIVTSDKDLLSLKNYAGADIIKPGAFLAMMEPQAKVQPLI